MSADDSMRSLEYRLRGNTVLVISDMNLQHGKRMIPVGGRVFSLGADNSRFSGDKKKRSETGSGDGEAIRSIGELCRQTIFFDSHTSGANGSW